MGSIFSQMALGGGDGSPKDQIKAYVEGGFPLPLGPLLPYAADVFVDFLHSPEGTETCKKWQDEGWGNPHVSAKPNPHNFLYHKYGDNYLEFAEDWVAERERPAFWRAYRAKVEEKIRKLLLFND